MSAPEPYDRPFAQFRSAPAGAQSTRAVSYRRESDPSAMGAKRRGETRGTWEKQLEDAEQYAEEHGLELVGDYLEAEQGDVWARPALQRMLADMRAGNFHNIIIWHPDRLSRDDEVKALFRREVRTAHARVHYVHFKQDDSPEGQMAEDAAGMVAKYEKKRIRQRTQTMRQERARSGTKSIAGGYPLYGYLWVRDERFRITTYALDPEHVRYVEEILTRLANREPKKHIIADLNARGVPTRGEVLKQRGLLSPRSAARVKNHWTRNMLAAIAFTPDYSGWHMNYHTVSEYEEERHPVTGMAVKRRRMLLRRRETEYLSLDELKGQYSAYLVPVPAIVSEDVHWAAQARFLSAKRAAGPRDLKHQDALFSGYVRCAYCRHPMAVRRVAKNPHRNTYFCTHGPLHAWTVVADCPVGSNQIRVDELDREVWDTLVAGLKQPGVLLAIIERAHAVVNEQERLARRTLDMLHAEKAEAEAEMAALVAQAREPDLHPVGRRALNAEMTKVGERIERLDAFIAAESVQDTREQARQDAVRGIPDWAASVADTLDTLDFDGKRRILYIVGALVEVRRTRRSPGADAVPAVPERAGEEPWPDQKDDPARWQLRTDFAGLGLGVGLASDVRPVRGVGSLRVDAENNARNYSIVNAIQLQMLLDQPPGKGAPLPDVIQAALAQPPSTEDADRSDTSDAD